MVEKVKKRKIVTACYDHLGGRLGELLFQLLISKQLISRISGTRKYKITPTGYEALQKLGVNIEKIRSSSRIAVSPCIERSSGQYYEHLGAHLGSLLTARLVELGWLIPRPEKEYEITAEGLNGLANLGLNINQLNIK